MRSPGRKPSRSPASTAGRVRMMRSTSLACSACTAMATASQLLPVPAGPRPKVMMLSRDGVDVALLAARLGPHRAAPRRRSTSVVSTSRRALVGLDHVDGAADVGRRRGAGPPASSSTSSSNSRPTRSASPPSSADLVAPHVDGGVGEGGLDEAEQLVALAEQARHEVVAGNEDLDLGRGCTWGGRHSRFWARTLPVASVSPAAKPFAGRRARAGGGGARSCRCRSRR